MSVDIVHTGVARIACTSCVSNPANIGIDVSKFDKVIKDVHINEEEAAKEYERRVIACLQNANSFYNEVEEAWITESALSTDEKKKVQDFVKEYLLIAKTNNEDSSDKSQQMMHSLLQVSKFILFLEEQEKNTAAYDLANSKNTLKLTGLKARMKQLVCTARAVLKDVSDSDIMDAVKSKIDRTLSLAGVNSGDVQRVVCAISVQTMIDELETMNS